MLFRSKGILILGTSAGAMILGEFYFSAKYGTISSEEAMANPDEERICIEKKYVNIPCLKDTLVESHYRNRDRQGRLKIFLQKAGPTAKGIGLDESAALCISKKKREVVGVDGVHYMTQN